MAKQHPEGSKTFAVDIEDQIRTPQYGNSLESGVHVRPWLCGRKQCSDICEVNRSVS